MNNTAIPRVLLVVATLACGQRLPAGEHPATIGVVARFGEGQWCLAVADSTLLVGDTIVSIAIPIGPSASTGEPGVFEVTRVHPGTCGPMWGVLEEVDYELELAGGERTTGPPGPSVSVPGADAILVAADAAVQVDLDGDGDLETFRSCTSSEGLHLTLWEGAPLESVLLWHRYFSLGYDVEPSCTDADFSDPQ